MLDSAINYNNFLQKSKQPFCVVITTKRLLLTKTNFKNLIIKLNFSQFVL
jgi:hypothetical protein